MREHELEPGRMLDLIRSKSFEGRKALIAELRREKSARSVSLLMEILKDESWSLRELAVNALSELPDLAAPRLMSLLESGLWYTRAAAARALGLMGHGPALPRVLAMLDDSNQTISQDAARALLDMARTGHSIAVARGIVARGPDAEGGLLALDRVDPDAGRRVRILAAREEVAAPVREWLDDEEGTDPEFLEAHLLSIKDEDMDVRWEDVYGPVGGH